MLAIQICLGYYCKRLNNSALLYFTYKFGNKIVSFLAETLFSFFSHFSLCFNEELQNLDYLSFIVSLTQWKKIEYIIHQVCFTFFFPIIYKYIYIYYYWFLFSNLPCLVCTICKVYVNQIETIHTPSLILFFRRVIYCNANSSKICIICQRMSMFI